MKRYVVIFLVGVIIGMLWYKFRLPPFPQWIQFKENIGAIKKIPSNYKKYQIVNYVSGTKLFIDRPYYDSIGDERLDGLYLIQVERHRDKSDLITIKTDNTIEIYRIISDQNSNKNLIHTYDETDIQVNVIGKSSVHSSVVKKKFSNGVINLSPGGDVSTQPILISFTNNSLPNNGFEIIP